MLGWILENSILALAVALIVLVLERKLRARPAAVHVMWVTVLLVLVLPPIALRSPIAVRGFFRPHFEGMEAAAWARLNRTDPMISWVRESVAPSVFDQSSAKAPPDLSDSTSSRAQSMVNSKVPGFDLSPAGEQSAGRLSIETKLLPSPPVLMPIMATGVIRGLWLGSAAIVLIVFLLRVHRVRRLLRHASRAQGSLTEQVRSVAQDLGVRVPQIYVLPGLSSPMVWGVGRPMLLWPCGLDATAPGSRAMIGHELAHLRRHDHWTAVLEVFVTALLWWHPLARLAMSRIDRFSEQACDAWAVRSEPAGRRAYAEALISVVERLSEGRRRSIVLAAAGRQGRRALADRLGMVMRPDTRPSCSRAVLLGSTVLLALLIPSVSPAGNSQQESQAVAPQSSIDERINKLIEVRRLAYESRQWFYARQWDKAEQTLAEFLVLDPDNENARARHGITLMHLGQLDQAENEMRAALDQSVREAELRFWLAGVLSTRGQTLEARTQLELALELGLDYIGRLRTEEVFASIVSDTDSQDLLSRAQSVHDLRRRARLALQSRDSTAAIAALESLSQLSPRDGSTWHFLSYARIAGGQLEQALVSLDRQQALGYRAEVAEYNRACVYAMQGQVQEGVRAFARSVELGFSDYELAQKDEDLDALRMDAEFARTLDRITRPARIQREIQVAAEFKDWTRVIELCDEILAINPGKLTDWARVQRAVAAAYRGDSESASESLIETAVDGARLGEVLFGLSQIAAIEGQRDLAEQYLIGAAKAGVADEKRISESLLLAPIADSKAFRSALLGVLERQELESFRVSSWGALETRARSTLDRHPEIAQAKHELGWALLRQGRFDEARALFESLAESGWNVGASSYNVACCFARSKDSDQAMIWLRKAARAGLTNPDLLMTDRDLRSLRFEPEFEQLVDELRAQAARELAQDQ